MIGSILDDDAQFDHLILKSRFYISLLNWITQLFTLLIGILLRSPLLWSSDRYLMNLNDRLDRSFLYLFRCFPINLSLSLLSPRGLARDNNLSFHVQHVTIKFHLFFQIFIFFIWLYFDSLNWNLYWLRIANDTHKCRPKFSVKVYDLLWWGQTILGPRSRSKDNLFFFSLDVSFTTIQLITISVFFFSMWDHNWILMVTIKTLLIIWIRQSFQNKCLHGPLSILSLVLTYVCVHFSFWYIQKLYSTQNSKQIFYFVWLIIGLIVLLSVASIHSTRSNTFKRCVRSLSFRQWSTREDREREKKIFTYTSILIGKRETNVWLALPTFVIGF